MLTNSKGGSKDELRSRQPALSTHSLGSRARLPGVPGACAERRATGPHPQVQKVEVLEPQGSCAFAFVFLSLQQISLAAQPEPN